MVRSVRYEVRLRVDGQLPPAWSVLLGGLEVARDPDGTTVVGGALPDQAALHGLLDAIRDLGLSLVSVDAVARPRSPSIGG
jgi:hypothetical protein